MTTALATPVQTVTLTRTVHAPINTVYRAFTDADLLTYWFADNADLRPAVGGHVFFAWNTNYHAVGTFTEVEQDSRASFTWRGAGETSDSQIEVALKSEGETTQFTLTISGFSSEAEDTIRREWDTRLGYLVTILEDGADRRITDRVIMGVIPDAIDDKERKELGLKDGHGMKVTGLIDGYSAAKAGIQSGDIMVEVNGKSITQEQPSNVILANARPGDHATATYLRGGQKHTVDIELLGYPVPARVGSVAELTEAAEKVYKQYDADFTAVLADQSEEILTKHPAEKEWNVKEVIAHLVLNERWFQMFIGGMLQGPEIVGYACNHPARIGGLTATYPTTAALADELRRAWRETLGIIANLPEDLTAPKTRIWWINFEVDGLRQHTNGHFDQMRAAINSALGK